MRNAPPVSETKLGPREIERPDVIILIPHGRTGDAFLAGHTGITTMFRKDMHARQRQEYLRLESDFGSRELGHGTAAFLDRKLSGQKSIQVLDVQLPLGIIDVLELDINRAVRRVFKRESRLAAIDMLRPLHDSAIGCINRAVDGLKLEGVLLAVHTMSPYDRILTLDEGDLEEPATYVLSYCDPDNRGEERTIDLITSLRGGKSRLADEKLVRALKAELDKRHLTHGENEPFPILAGTLQEQIMRRRRMLAVDVPKHLVAHGNRERVASRLVNLRVDESKMATLADCFSNAILEAMK